MQAQLVGPPAALGCRRLGWENHTTIFLLHPMSRLSSLPAALQNAVSGRRLLKVIAGLTNFDAAAVQRIARAAAAGGAD
ncbi:MAG: DUF561 domain-containing protein, partial [Cyanobacteriota bacterium]